MCISQEKNLGREELNTTVKITQLGSAGTRIHAKDICPCLYVVMPVSGSGVAVQRRMRGSQMSMVSAASGELVGDWEAHVTHCIKL